MFRAYADGSALENVALKAAMVMPAHSSKNLMPGLKPRIMPYNLEHRIRQWMDGDIESLMKG